LHEHTHANVVGLSHFLLQRNSFNVNGRFHALLTYMRASIGIVVFLTDASQVE